MELLIIITYIANKYPPAKCAIVKSKPPAVECISQVKVDRKNHQLLKPLFDSILNRGFVIKFVR